MGSCPGGSGRGGLVPRIQGSSESFPSRTSSASIPTSQAPFSSQFHSSASHSMVKLPLPAETMFWNYRHAILVLPPSRALRFTLWATQTPSGSSPMTTISSFTLRVSVFSRGWNRPHKTVLCVECRTDTLPHTGCVFSKH